MSWTSPTFNSALRVGLLPITFTAFLQLILPAELENGTRLIQCLAVTLDANG
jgi:hypothetical protein